MKYTLPVKSFRTTLTNLYFDSVVALGLPDLFLSELESLQRPTEVLVTNLVNKIVLIVVMKLVLNFPHCAASHLGQDILVKEISVDIFFPG